MGKHTEAIKKYLDGMDPNDERQWTRDGKPRMKNIEISVGDPTITREDVTEAWGGVFTRDTLTSARLDAPAADAPTPPPAPPREAAPVGATADDGVTGDGADAGEAGDVAPGQVREFETLTEFANVSPEVLEQEPRQFAPLRTGGEQDSSAGPVMVPLPSLDGRAIVSGGIVLSEGKPLIGPTGFGLTTPYMLGRHVDTAELTRYAFETSRQSADGWNALSDADRNANVRDALAFLTGQSRVSPAETAAPAPALAAPDDEVSRPPARMPPEWGAGIISAKAGPLSRMVTDEIANPHGQIELDDDDWYRVWMEQRLYAVERTTVAPVLVFPYDTGE